MPRSVTIEQPEPESVGEVFTDENGVRWQVLHLFNPATEHIEPRYERLT